MVILKMFKNKYGKLFYFEKIFSLEKKICQMEKMKTKKLKIPYFVEAYFVSLDNLRNRTIITCNF
jgi:hypothetical protein